MCATIKKVFLNLIISYKKTYESEENSIELFLNDKWLLGSFYLQYLIILKGKKWYIMDQRS